MYISCAPGRFLHCTPAHFPAPVLESELECWKVENSRYFSHVAQRAARETTGFRKKPSSAPRFGLNCTLEQEKKASGLRPSDRFFFLHSGAISASGRGAGNCTRVQEKRRSEGRSPEARRPEAFFFTCTTGCILTPKSGFSGGEKIFSTLDFARIVFLPLNFFRRPSGAETSTRSVSHALPRPSGTSAPTRTCRCQIARTRSSSALFCPSG